VPHLVAHCDLGTFANFAVAATLAVAGLVASVYAQNVAAYKEHGIAVQSTATAVSEPTVREYSIPSSKGPSCIKHLGLTVSR
jgi:hypothetical protein